MPTKETIVITIDMDAPELVIHISHPMFQTTLVNEAKPLKKLNDILYDFIVAHATAKAKANHPSVPKSKGGSKPSTNALIQQTLRMYARQDRYSLKKTLAQRGKHTG